MAKKKVGYTLLILVAGFNGIVAIIMGEEYLMKIRTNKEMESHKEAHFSNQKKLSSPNAKL